MNESEKKEEINENEEIEITEEMEKKIKEFQEKDVLDGMYTSNKIFCDLSLFFDFYIGTAMYLSCKKREEVFLKNHTLLNKNLKKWKKRFFDLPCYYLDLEEITDAEIYSFLENVDSNKKELLLALKSSPETKIISVLRRNLYLNKNHSFAKGDETKKIIFINTYPFYLDDKFIKDFGEALSKKFIGIEIKFCNIDYSKESPSFMDMYDEFYIRDLSALVEKNKEIAKSFSDMNYVGEKIIFSAPFFKPKKWLTDYSMKEKDRIDALSQIKAHMDMIQKKFNFIPRNDLAPRITEEENKE